MPKPVTIPLNTWLIHRHSRRAFQVTKIHQLHVETIEDWFGREERGYANRFLLEQDLTAGVYAIDKKGVS